MIYLVYIILLIFMLRLEQLSPSKHNIFRILMPLLFTLLIGLRSRYVGVDSNTYYQHYYTFGAEGCFFVEPGFDRLNQFCYHLGLPYGIFFLILAALTIAPISFAINYLNRKEYTWTALMMYILPFCTFCNGMRQGVAIGLFFYACMFVLYSRHSVKRKIVVYSSLILLGATFHVSVFVVAPLILLKNVKVPTIVLVAVYCLSFVFLFVDFSSYIPDLKFGTRDYSEQVQGGNFERNVSMLGFIVTTFLRLVILVAILTSRMSQRKPFILNMAVMSMCLSNFAYSISAIGRINFYFDLFIYTSIAIAYVESVSPRIMENLINFIISKVTNKGYEVKNNNSFKFLFPMIFAIYVMVTINTIFSAQNKLSPYTFFWDEIMLEI